MESRINGTERDARQNGIQFESSANNILQRISVLRGLPPVGSVPLSLPLSITGQSGVLPRGHGRRGGGAERRHSAEGGWRRPVSRPTGHCALGDLDRIMERRWWRQVN